MKYWELEIDGPDKTLKDLLCSYICILSNYKYSINVRGFMSQIVYTRKFKRNFSYDDRVINKNKVHILLTGEIEDIKTRCKISREPEYTIAEDLHAFKILANHMVKTGYRVLEYNTSENSIYVIAKDIIKKMEELNNG